MPRGDPVTETFVVPVIDTRKAVGLVGETLNDIGILVIVFGPLDAFFESEGPGLLFLVFAVVGGLFFITLGIILEAGEPGAHS
jgi:hypothetical protein